VRDQDSGFRIRVIFVASVELLAMMIWAGGMLALGAIAAPIVFGMVPSPTSADAMTAVFLRFDRVAMTCAAIALVAESVLGRSGGKIERVDLVRLAVVAIAGALAITQGAWLSPRIAELHQHGAIRGLGDSGLALESAHRWSERCGKTELALLVLAVFLVVAKARALQKPATRS
jgi:hypothetical protein